MHNETYREVASETISSMVGENPEQRDPSLPEVPDVPPVDPPRPPQEVPPDQTPPHSAPQNPPADPIDLPAIA
jgi:hypothetical protein